MNYLQLLPYDVISIINYYIQSYCSDLILSIYSKFNLKYISNKSLEYHFMFFTNKPIDHLYYFIINYNLAKKNNMSLKASLFWCNFFRFSPKIYISFETFIS